MAEAIADLVIRIGTDVEALKRDMNEVSRATRKTADEVDVSVGFIKSALGTLAGGFSLQALWNTFRAGVSELSALDDAAENAGTSVEKMGQLMADLAPSGASMGEISGLVQQLNRSLLQTENQTSRSSEAFKALGIDVKDANGNFKDGTDLLREIALALDKYEDGTNKSQLATALLGRAGAQNVAMLKDLARAQGETNRYTSEMAAKAEELDKALNRMQYQFGQWRTSMLSQLIPTMLEFITQLKEGTEAADGFWAAVFRYGFKYAPGKPEDTQKRILDDIKRETDLMNRAQIEVDNIKSLGGQDVYERDWKRENARLETHRQNVEKLQRDWQYFENIRIRNERATGGPTGRELMYGNAGYDAPAQAPKIRDAAADQRAAREQMQLQLERVAEMRRNATETEKEALEDLAKAVQLEQISERQAIEEKMRIRAQALAAQIGAANQQIAILERVDAKQRDLSGIERAKNERARLIRELGEVETRTARERLLYQDKLDDALEKSSAAAINAARSEVTASALANQRAREEIEALIQASVQGRDYTIVLTEMRVAKMRLAQENAAFGVTPEQAEALRLAEEQLSLMRQRAGVQQQIDAQKQRAASEAKYATDAIKAAEERAKEASNTIKSSLTDALLRGFEDGKSFAENFRDTIKNMFMTMVLRPIIEPVMKPVADIAGSLVSAIVSAATGGFGAKGAPVTSLTSDPGLGLKRPAQPRAAGGPVIPGGTYIVGEEGVPEILQMGRRGGYVTPMAKGGVRPVQINQTFHINSGVDATTAQSIWMASKEAAKAEIADAMSRSGRGIYS